MTFSARTAAKGWLANERRLIELDAWTPPAQRAAQKKVKGLTLAEYGPTWIDQRTKGGQPLKPRTKSHYEALFKEHIKPTKLGKTPLKNLTPESVRDWHATTRVDKTDVPRSRLWAVARDVGNRCHRWAHPE